MSVLQGTEFYISKRVGKAIMDYQMLADGDKIAVAVSAARIICFSKIACGIIMP